MTKILQMCLGRKDIIDLLLQNYAPMNLKNKDGDAPLHVAVKEGRRQIVQDLIDNFADINLQNKIKNTPLHVALVLGNFQFDFLSNRISLIIF